MFEPRKPGAGRDACATLIGLARGGIVQKIPVRIDHEEIVGWLGGPGATRREKRALEHVDEVFVRQFE